MKRDLKNSLNREKDGSVRTPEALQEQIPDPNTLQQVQKAVDQYSQKSESALLEDLKGFQRAGMMDQASLYSVAQQIAPMLNPQQQQRLYSILQELKR